tara:strand:+ start:2468 stop:2860 length:393 start_codon:yes stop_codon:yes gene_type:complete
MSHFTTIKTQIKDKDILLEALEILQIDVKENQELVINNPRHAENHPVQMADICFAKDAGFRYNEDKGVYELVADITTWQQTLPPLRFIEKITQQYARMSVHRTIKDLGYQVKEEWEMEDNSIEIYANVWN